MPVPRDFVQERRVAALEAAAAELRQAVLRSCGDKAPGVLALLDQAVRAALQATQAES